MKENPEKARLRERLFAMSADLALFNGNVITINQKQPRAEAVAVKGGKIIGVGRNSEIKQYCGPKTETLDLKGKTLLPGFIDSHSHMIISGTALLGVDCGINTNKSINDILVKVKERAETLPKGAWIEGSGYDDTLMAEKRHPNRWDLDKVAPDHLVVIHHISGHLSAVNSRALALAGISKDTPDPEGGEIFRDERGEPIGVLAEPPAQILVRRLIPPKTVDDLLKGLQLANAKYVEAGVTTTNDGGMHDDIGLLVYEKAHSSSSISIRAYANSWTDELEEILEEGQGIDKLGICSGCGDEWVKMGAAKITQDGSIQGLTGALLEPYVCDPSRTGILIHPQEELDEMVLKYHKAGFQVQIHGNGDRAIESILLAYERALAAYPRSDHRHHIIHCQMVSEDQLRRMAKLGVVANFFPVHVYYWGDRHRDLFIGPQRAARIDPLKSALNHGVIFGLHTDYPVTPISPLWDLYSAVARETRDGQILGKDQAISVEEALKALTINAAYLIFEEHIKGSIEIGKLADFVVISADPFQIAPSDLKGLQVELTIVGGKTVYQGS